MEEEERVRAVEEEAARAREEEERARMEEEERVRGAATDLPPISSLAIGLIHLPRAISPPPISPARCG